MKGSIPFWSVVLFAWIIGGRMIGRSTAACNCAGATAAVTSAAAAGTTALSNLIIGDAGQTVASANSNLMYALSSPAFIEDNIDGVNEQYEKVATHLKAHPEKLLFLTGLYHSDEKNDTDMDNLGLARANNLREHFINKFETSSDQIIITSNLNDNLSKDDKYVHGGMWYDFISEDLSISDGVNFHERVEDNFVFDQSSFNYKEPLSEDLDKLFSKAATYISGNENLTLRITGLYADDETNTDEETENIGLARANMIKKIFTELGLNEEKIIIDAAEIDASKFNKSKLKGGIHLDILGAVRKGEAKGMTNRSPSSMKDAAEGVANAASTTAASAVAVVNNAKDKISSTLKTKEVIQDQKLTIRFSPSTSEIQFTDEQEVFMNDLVAYLNANPDAVVDVIGHTDDDNVSEERAYVFGRKRARKIRDEFEKRGVNIDSQVEIDSQGSLNPIEDNSTSEGRAANRRVEISLR